MTKEEASRRYRIPPHILDEYESWGLCGVVKKVMGAWQYDDEDLERLSTIMTLHDIGFTAEEVETYMRLLLEQPDSDRQRLRMMEAKQATVEDKISEIRLFNRAKWLLIQQEGISEADAQHRLEKQAMDNRVSKKQVAEEIIKIYA